MEQDNTFQETEFIYPILLMPKKCTTLESTCDGSDNIYIDLNISSTDTEGHDMLIYSGFCNVKLVDQDCSTNTVEPNTSTEYTTVDNVDSQVWIDPVRSPYVYNRYEGLEPLYSVEQTKNITVEQRHTYITQNIYNCRESSHYHVDEFEHKKFRKNTGQQGGPCDFNNLYEEDEFQCGVFLSQLPEEIIIEKETKAREERKYIGMESDNSALKQLMSPGIQSVSKQRKTILFLGHDSSFGQTIQKITVTDPTVECSRNVDDMDPNTVVDPHTATEKPTGLANQKKYQCEKCKQLFDFISDFRQHMVGNHRSPNRIKRPRKQQLSYKSNSDSKSETDILLMCNECGKTMKSQQKYDMHCLSHGDPDLECNKCHKVFASKFTLRAHRKLHERKYECEHCPRSFGNPEDLKNHRNKIHSIYPCDVCEYTASNYLDLVSHNTIAHDRQKEESETDIAESYVDDHMNEDDIILLVPVGREMKLDSEQNQTEELNIQGMDVMEDTTPTNDEIREADSIIAKVVNNKVFSSSCKKKRSRRYNKVCEVCHKTFDRIGDLKRHLIEHMIRSTLAKTPVTKNGTLNIQCEVCQIETFTKIDKYKAHLREHAKLTLYKCTFCDKTFSDSSNFSKHKKIHGATYFQCDLCQRKFNSKKMISRHMEYHMKNSPLPCSFCDKIFHFKSMLDKHIRTAHKSDWTTRFRCKFCHDYFKSLKEKWDHEWHKHNVRKMIADCLICEAQFRKYSDLKRHCHEAHDVDLLSRKNIRRNSKYVRLGPVDDGYL